MSAQEQVEVLVVGAGPTGLTLTAILGRFGIRTRVVEKNAARSDKSKAIGVQAGTLEACGHFFGAQLPDKMVAAGHPAREVFVHIGDRPPARVDLSQVPSAYNFILMLAQSETERLLEEEVEKSALAVERNKELVSFENVDQRIVAHVKDREGGLEEIASDFVVGCDGAHSVVRHQAAIPYAGGAYEGNFVLGDVTLRWPWNDQAARVFLADRGLVACFPLKGGPGSYRLILVANAEATSSASEITADEFCEMLSSLAPVPITILDFVWLTRFRLHHRMAQHFRSGRAFLAGDAAHIHSPIGGQGMNTGILDALNLGCKLAGVLRRGAGMDTLDCYERERLPVARRVLRSTDLAFEIATADRGLLRLVRSLVAPRLIAARFIQKRMLRAISQVDVARREMRQCIEVTP